MNMVSFEFVTCHQKGDLTPAETKFDYLRFAKVLYEERNGFKRFGAAKGGTLLSRSYFLKERKCARFTSKEKTHETIRMGE